MKNRIQGIIIGFIVALLLMSTVAFAASAQKTITVTYSGLKIMVDGKLITPKTADGSIVEPFVFEGTNYLPIRALGNAFGFSNDDIYWDSETNTVYFTTPSDVDDESLHEYWDDQKEK